MPIKDFAPLPFSLRQLQYVVAVAEVQGFRKAAERCHVSQPSLSAQIAELESVLGTRLFERSRRGVLLTRAGRVFVERARLLLVDAAELASSSSAFTDPLAGTLRVGVIPTIAPYLLPRVVPALRRALPELTLEWLEDKTEVLVERVTHGTLDAALLALEADLGALEHFVVRQDPFVVAVPPDHPLAHGKRPLDMAALAGEAVLLLDDGHCFRDQALDVCAQAGSEELGFRATSLGTLVQMVSSGAGITLLPEIAVPTECQRTELFTRRFRNPPPHRTLVLAYRPASAIKRALAELAGVMRDAAR